MQVRRNRIVLLSIIIVLLIGTVLVSCASSEKTLPIPTGGVVRTNNGGAVTIDVEWLTEEKNSLVFDVAMNTHSVQLDDYDLKQLAVLRDGEGSEFRPTSWDSASGGHHRNGRLTFALPDSLRQSKAKSIVLIIRDVAGVAERVFEWEL